MGCCHSDENDTKEVQEVDTSTKQPVDFINPCTDFIEIEDNQIRAVGQINSSTISLKTDITSGVWKLVVRFTNSQSERSMHFDLRIKYFI